MLETLDYSVIDRNGVLEQMARDYHIVSDLVGTVLSWNTDRLKGTPAATWPDSGAKLHYHLNQALCASDSWAVPKGAKNIKRLMEFTAFAMQGPQQLTYSKLLPYGHSARRPPA